MFVTPNVSEIRKRREGFGWSQHQLSIQAGLSGCAICRIESEKTKRINHLRAREIARALNCKVEDIFNDTKGV